MSAESLALLARLSGIVAGALIACSAITVWLRRRSAGAAVWTLAAGVALGCTAWVHAGGPRDSGAAWITLGAAWLVPCLVAAVSARIWRVAAVAVGVAGAIVAALAQPFWDPDCRGACRPEDALFVADPRPAMLGGLIVAAAAGVIAGAHARRSPLAVIAAGAGAYWAIDAVAQLPSAGGATIVLVLAGAGIIVGILAWPPAIRAVSARAGLRRLAEPIATPADRAQVERMLAAALGDPTVRLALPREPVERVATAIVRGDQLVATIDSARPLDPLRVESALTPAVRIGIDDERLRHDIGTRLEELEASRERLLEMSDRERRRLERNVHDGAQQYLIAALAQLGLSGKDSVETALGVRGTLERLRALTSGVASPVLDSAGLAPALAALADRIDARLEVSGTLELEGRTARDVYAIVAAAAAAVDRLGVPRLTVAVEITADAILVRMTPADAVAGRIGDRVAALGGAERQGSDGEWEVTLPCA